MKRWKCPDCKGWVADTVTVHYCDPGHAATPAPLPVRPWPPSDGASTARPYWPSPVIVTSQRDLTNDLELVAT